MKDKAIETKSADKQSQLPEERVSGNEEPAILCSGVLKQIDTLRKQLARYGSHDPECVVRNATECSCGLRQALHAHKNSAELMEAKSA
jgi:hypothetical protein